MSSRVVVFVYARDQLFVLSQTALLPWSQTCNSSGAQEETPGVQSRRTRLKQSVRSIIMGNVRSLGNKIDVLCTLIRTQMEYVEGSILCFMEIWLHVDFLDYSAIIS